MLKLIGVFTSLFLTIIIVLRSPQNDVGLASFASNSNLLGSPRSARRFLNVLTAIGIFIFLGVAIQLNLQTI